MSVNLTRSGHPMVIVNRILLCNTREPHSGVLTKILQLIVFYALSSTECEILVCIAILLWCAFSITMWHSGCYFADSPKSIQYFCHSKLSTLWQLNAHETRFIGFLPHWNIFYQFREIHLILREVHLASWQKYILFLDRNTFCWAHLLYFREELAAVLTFELQSVEQRLWRTNDISNPSVSYFPSFSFTLSPSIVCLITL